MNGIVGPLVYQPKYGPTYKTSFSASIGLISFAIIMICITWRLVAKKDRELKEAGLDDKVPGRADNPEVDPEAAKL